MTEPPKTRADGTARTGNPFLDRGMTNKKKPAETARVEVRAVGRHWPASFSQASPIYAVGRGVGRMFSAEI
jgi:hypothetical protein